ncbi:FISUMP domain-containing protein [Fibrobacter sp.]|uniref:FISUMP domain-containing protein n=1 Tax=Fibrobacter sp. TaxID=35828 RepID=UPI0038910FA8
MNKKLLALCTSTFFLFACDDGDGNTVSPRGEGDEPYCTVTKGKNSVSQEIYEPGKAWGEATVTIDNGEVIVRIEQYFYGTEEEIDEKCYSMDKEKAYFDKGSYFCGQEGAAYTISGPASEDDNIDDLALDMESDCRDLEEDWDEYGDEYFKASSSSMGGGSSSGQKSYASFNVHVSGQNEYNAIVDPRDGKSYRVVVVGEQAWFLDNLQYEGPDGRLQTGNSWTFWNNYSLANVTLYDYPAAMGSKFCKDNRCNKDDDIVQGICPDGWALPTNEAWEYLSKNIKDLDGFFAQPTGEHGGSFNEDNVSRYWSSTEKTSGGAVEWYYRPGGRPTSQEYSKQMGYGIRCVATEDVKLTVYMESFYNDFAHDPDNKDILCEVFGICESSSSVESSSSMESSSSIESSSSMESSSSRTSAVFSSGSFTDERDNTTYNYIDIEGTLWMTENLKFADSTTVVELAGNTWCIGIPNDEETCEKGNLYTFNAAQSACPEGWRVPTLAEWRFLDPDENIFAQLKIEATGEYLSQGIHNHDNVARFWTSDSDGNSSASGGHMVYFHSNETTLNSQPYNKETGYAVRCILDEAINEASDETDK